MMAEEEILFRKKIVKDLIKKLKDNKNIDELSERDRFTLALHEMKLLTFNEVLDG